MSVQRSVKGWIESGSACLSLSVAAVRLVSFLPNNCDEERHLFLLRGTLPQAAAQSPALLLSLEQWRKITPRAAQRKTIGYALSDRYVVR